MRRVRQAGSRLCSCTVPHLILKLLRLFRTWLCCSVSVSIPKELANFKLGPNYGWKKYCAGKNIALLKERCLKWLLSKRCPCCRFFDKNSPNSASFYPICTGFSRSISTERGLSFQLRGWGGSDQYFGSHFNLKTL